MNRELFARLVSRSARLLVVGDLMLDRYTRGQTRRVSDEAAVLVLREEGSEDRLGGAANVASALAVLGAEVALAGVVGCDANADIVRGLLGEQKIRADDVLCDDSRPTTTKERFLGQAAHHYAHQVLRVDRESQQPLSEALESSLVERLARRVEHFDAVLISDYAKGVCTSRLVRALVEVSREAGVPVLVDPPDRLTDDKFRGASLLKPNRREAGYAAGARIDEPADAFCAGRRLCQQMELGAVLVTMDRQGLVLVTAGGQQQHFPARSRAVSDITGAGDIVLAMLGLCAAAGLSWESAAKLANVAAGIAVEKPGAAAVSWPEIERELIGPTAANTKLVTLDEMEQRAEEHRRSGDRIVMTNGCFDLLHSGHVTYLSEAARAGDVLIVAINSDAGIRRLKGPQRPVIRAADRAAMLAALAAVDYVLVFDDDTPHGLLRQIRPDVLVKGGNYAAHEVVGHEIVRGYGGEVRVAGLVEGISTSEIIRSIADGSRERAAPPPSPLM